MARRRRAIAGVEFKIEDGSVIVETRDPSMDVVRLQMEWVVGIAAELERAATIPLYRS